MSDPIDIAIKRAEQPAEPAKPAMLRVDIPMQCGIPAALIIPTPITPVDVVGILIAVADVIQGRVEIKPPAPTERIWTPPA